MPDQSASGIGTRFGIGDRRGAAAAEPDPAAEPERILRNAESTDARTDSCSRSTRLGGPVVPDVVMMSATSSS